jgi:hypothetical protein
VPHFDSSTDRFMYLFYFIPSVSLCSLLLLSRQC